MGCKGRRPKTRKGTNHGTGSQSPQDARRTRVRQVDLPEESVGQRLKGKKILLTGTTKGVGRVTQELLCAHGAFVCGSGRTPGVAASVADELKAKGYQAAGMDVDLSDYDAVKKWVEECAELMGGIDVVINNASHLGMAPFGEMTPDIWNYGIKNELDLVYNVCNCAWPYLQKADGASIIITSSTVGLQGSNSPQACHAACKGACLSLARQLAAEGGPFGIRCNSVTPGLVLAPRPCPTSPRRWQAAWSQPRPPSRLSTRWTSPTPTCSWHQTSPPSTAANIPVDGGCAGAVTGGMQGEIEV